MPYQPAEMDSYPSHRIPWLQPMNAAVFMEEVGAFGVIPMQYVAMSGVKVVQSLSAELPPGKAIK